MTTDVDMLWALVAGVLAFAMAVGVMAVVEGFTRQRSVSSGVARHLGAVAGAIFGSIAADSVFDIGLATDASRWLHVASSVLFATIALGATAERATFAAHVVVGAVVGAVLVPAGIVGRGSDGLLSSISIGSDTFSDAAAATLFAAAGWMALVGATIIGPRRGWVGEDGHVRSMPGKSMAAAVGGAIAIVAMSPGLAVLPQQAWTDGIVGSATWLVFAAAIGAVVAVGLGWRSTGAVGTPAIVSGAVAGLVAASGAPLDLSLVRAAAAGVVGAVVVTVVQAWLVRMKIDDPSGVVSMFGAPGVAGSLLVATSFNAVTAQFVGVLIVVVASALIGGVVFGVLRVARLLRVSTDIELVGLDR